MSKETISFKAIKVVSKPAKIEFTTKDGRSVEFKADRDIPRAVRAAFRAKVR